MNNKYIHVVLVKSPLFVFQQLQPHMLFDDDHHHVNHNELNAFDVNLKINQFN